MIDRMVPVSSMISTFIIREKTIYRGGMPCSLIWGYYLCVQMVCVVLGRSTGGFTGGIIYFGEILLRLYNDMVREYITCRKTDIKK